MSGLLLLMYISWLPEARPYTFLLMALSLHTPWKSSQAKMKKSLALTTNLGDFLSVSFTMKFWLS